MHQIFSKCCLDRKVLKNFTPMLIIEKIKAQVLLKNPEYFRPIVWATLKIASYARADLFKKVAPILCYSSVV